MENEREQQRRILYIRAVPFSTQELTLVNAIDKLSDLGARDA
jgi:hypothetical protein